MFGVYSEEMSKDAFVSFLGTQILALNGSRNSTNVDGNICIFCIHTAVNDSSDQEYAKNGYQEHVKSLFSKTKKAVLTHNRRYKNAPVNQFFFNEMSMRNISSYNATIFSHEYILTKRARNRLLSNLNIFKTC